MSLTDEPDGDLADQQTSKTPVDEHGDRGQGQQDTPTVWLIRAGRDGDRFDYNVEHGLACLGWDDVPDLRSFSSREELRDALRLHFPDSKKGTISSYTSQLWRMRTDVRLGDLVVMPRKGAPEIALGSVAREYWYDNAADMGWGRHVVSVDWKRTDVPRSALDQDLVGSLSAQMTICSITRNDASWRIHQLLATGHDPGPRVGKESESLDLSTLVEQFLAETDYRTEAHEEQERLRAEWAEKLALENIESLSREDLTAFTNHAVNNGEYVRRVGGVMRWIRDLGQPEFNNLLDNVRYLCWGEDELSVRFDQLYLDDGPRKVKGYAGVNISRTLAICHPSSFLPVHRNVGNWGRAKMLSKLGLPAPLGNTPGQRVVDANDRLREHLEPHFGDDTLGMGAFLGWLLLQDPDPRRKPINLDELADELLIDVEFLKDIVSLLEDKGQVILYGPPGTGKTYLARELAKELAPDDSCWALVQFHPSTSYEDFFEGYRPAGTGNDGNVRYELTPGPLARMAEQASESPDKQHVMIIDEINRGNLPRVLGELLFLLEYRKESVQTLYRPEEPFELPENLWFIGTMNTADRSIALVDAALRRRFHFVPFFPDSGPMAGLLDRWLKAQQPPGPAWVGQLVDGVNDELKTALEGSHLLLGPSHFMKEYGSSPDEQRRRLRRIWEYNIEPFIEDQFFGTPDQIARFRFDAVMRRHGPAATSDDDSGDPEEGTNDSEDDHAASGENADAEPSSTQPEDE